MESQVFFFRRGQKLTHHKASGLTYVGADGKTGVIRRFTCRRAIVVADPRLPGKTWHLGPEDFGGPTMVKVVTGDRETMFALATQKDVADAGGQVITAAAYLPRSGAAAAEFSLEPFSDHPAHIPGKLFRSVKLSDIPFGVARWPVSSDSIWRQWQKEALQDMRRRNPARV